MPLKTIPKNNLKLLDIESLRWLVEEISKTNKDFSYRDLIDDGNYNLKSSLYVIVIGKTTNPSTKTMLEVTTNVINYLNNNNPDLIKKLKFYNIWEKDDWKNVWELLDCNAQEFNEFASEYKMKFETVRRYMWGKVVPYNYPRYQSTLILCAFFLFKKFEYDNVAKYLKKATVHRNPTATKLQLVELRSNKFWKDQNNGT
jgi:hypothetical protein